MKKREIADLQVLLSHIAHFIDAVPDTSDQSVNWSELSTLRRSAVESLQRLQQYAEPVESAESGNKCPGALPKH